MIGALETRLLGRISLIERLPARSAATHLSYGEIHGHSVCAGIIYIQYTRTADFGFHRVLDHPILFPSLFLEHPAGDTEANDRSFWPRTHISTTGWPDTTHIADTKLTNLSYNRPDSFTRSASNRLSRAELEDRRSIHRTIVITTIVHGSNKRYDIVCGIGRGSEPANSSLPLQVAGNPCGSSTRFYRWKKEVEKYTCARVRLLDSRRAKPREERKSKHSEPINAAN